MTVNVSVLIGFWFCSLNFDMKCDFLNSLIIVWFLLCCAAQALTERLNKKVRNLWFYHIFYTKFTETFFAFITNYCSCYSLSFMVKFWGWDLPQTKLNCQKWKIVQMGCIMQKRQKSFQNNTCSQTRQQLVK